MSSSIDSSPASAGTVAVVAEAPRVPVALFALSTGIIITNLFAPQMLVGLMAARFGLSTSASGIIPMVPLLGYAAGLLFLVPLADLVENRRLILRMLSCAAIAAAGVLFAPGVVALTVLLFILGAASSAIQVLVPAAAAMAAPEHRGKIIGDIMSGVMVGILLSRPIASFLAGIWGWQAFYVFSAVSVGLLAATLALRLPVRQPERTVGYGGLIASLWHLFAAEPVLRRRAISAGIVMAAFNLFWTTIAYVLSREPLHLGQRGIALFAMAGAGGAVVTPLVGRLSDRGLGNRVTTTSHLVLMAGFGLAVWSGLSASAPAWLILMGLGLSAVLLDVGVLGDQTVGRYLINQLRPEARGRINGIFVGIFFIGGAVGSALSSVLWSSGGWAAVCAGGASLGLLAFATRSK